MFSDRNRYQQDPNWQQRQEYKLVAAEPGFKQELDRVLDKLQSMERLGHTGDGPVQIPITDPERLDVPPEVNFITLLDSQFSDFQVLAFFRSDRGFYTFRIDNEGAIYWNTDTGREDIVTGEKMGINPDFSQVRAFIAESVLEYFGQNPYKALRGQ